MDPILDEFVSGGGNRIDPPRRLHTEKIVGGLSAVIVSHRHDDHFSAPDLLQIENLSSTPIYIPVHAQLERELRSLGARDIRQLRPWETAQVDDLEITATPSRVDFPEMGVAFRSGDCLSLNLVDTVYRSFAEEMHRRFGAPGLALVPFQAGGYAEFYPLRMGGPPPGLVHEIRTWSEFALADHLAAVRSIAPRCVASFADGLCYTDASINAWHFPTPPQQFISRLIEMGIPAHEALPGARFTLGISGETEVSRADDLVASSGSRAERAFRPETVICPRPAPWRDVADPRMNRGGVFPSFIDGVDFVRSHLGRINERRFKDPDRSLRSWLDDWELRLYDYDSAREVRLVLRASSSGGDLGVVEARPDSPPAPYGVALHGADLAMVLERSLSVNVLLHGGHYRYWSPSDDGRLELLFDRTVGKLLNLLRIT